MYLTILVSVLLAALIGLITKFILERINGQYRISWLEYLIVMVVISAVGAPGSIYVGWEIAKKNQVVFHEFWNGWELAVEKEDVQCSRDGPCYWEYDCDPYVVFYNCNCDEKGNCQTCMRIEYHSCPYVTVESNYYIDTTLGRYTIYLNRFPEDPDSYRWRPNHSIPDGVIENAGVGEPPFWIEAKKRINSECPGPVTQRHDYNNYIYASDQSILRQYHDAVAKYEALGLFPQFQKNIFNFYESDKTYFVGFSPKDPKLWRSLVSYFNAALGSVLEGDLHFVAVNVSKIDDFEEYALALRAYWQDKKRHGRDVMSKNSIVVVCATDGQAITKARSFTGMPLGNEDMLVAIDSRLKGVPFEPLSVIGRVGGKLKGRSVTSETASGGILEDVIFGISDLSTKFRRISMVKKDAGDVGEGFLYLVSEIQPTARQKKIIFLATFIFCSLGWLGAALADDRQLFTIKFFKKRKGGRR